MTTMTAAKVKELLQLEPLPAEGGFFRETYRSKTSIPKGLLSNVYQDDRNIGTAIYYLLTPETSSALHLLPGDEIFHFYSGDPIEMLQLHPNGTSVRIIIGNDLIAGQLPQVVVPGGTWQGSRLLPGGTYALLGTTMSPGFEFADFVAGERDKLIATHPSEAELIAVLT